MRKFQFNHNDYVSVTLTKEGAAFLSLKRKEFYETYPQIKVRSKESFSEGEIYRTQFWVLLSEFGEVLQLGMQSPFELGKITVESSLESQKTNMNNFEQKGKTIQEIRDNKAILQSEILKLIRKFEEDNEGHVQYVHLTGAHHLSNPLPETVEVRADFMV